jgi:hypothetical protein
VKNTPCPPHCEYIEAVQAGEDVEVVFVEVVVGFTVVEVVVGFTGVDELEGALPPPTLS